MALWMNRAGSQGQYESKFLDEGRIYLTWDDLNTDLKKIKDKRSLYEFLPSIYPNAKVGALRNYVGQIWPFVHDMKEGDWVVLPSKMKAAIHFGEIKGDYSYNPKAEDPFYHHRLVDWFALDVPRSKFDQDILYSFGAFMTVCRIKRNDAENRVRSMAANDWAKRKIVDPGIEDDEREDTDLEQLAKDQIAKYIIRKYKGHGMAYLIEAILNAQGYTTYCSPAGPDKGVDLLAAPGALGFGSPRICVQVKTTDAPVDRPTLDQLIGTMQNFNADQGLLVSWGGFKGSVDKEIPNQFFKVRLWDQSDIINELIKNYSELDEELRAELPLKSVWMLSLPEEDQDAG